MSNLRRGYLEKGLALILVCFFILSFCLPRKAADYKLYGKAKNVIVLVGDGMGSTHTALARWYKGGASLALDEIASGAIGIYSAESLITDSAPAATAFATGYKSNDKFVGIAAEKVIVPGACDFDASEPFRPLATILEGAKSQGKATGTIATSNLQHATPAGFSAHWHSQGNYEEIGKQQVYQHLNVAFGGGKKYLLPRGKGGILFGDGFNAYGWD